MKTIIQKPLNEKTKYDFRIGTTYLLLVEFKSGRQVLWIYRKWDTYSDRIVELGTVDKLSLSLASTLSLDDPDILKITDITESTTLTIQL